MSQPYRQGGQPDRPQPIECNPNLITKAQLNYIEILKKKLNLSGASLNALILSTLPKYRYSNTLYLLSKSEASHVIGKMKEWIEERDL